MFFFERAKQLLKSGGVAAIILPSSILSNGNIYTRMRELMLKYFDIVAIAEFGSGTFGKTGTNTATMFLRKKDNKPEFAVQFKNCVDQWFKGDLDYTSHYKIPTMEWIDNYCKKINISADDYKTLLNGEPNKKLLSADIFKEYKKDFESSMEYKNIQKKKITDKYTKKVQEQETEKAYMNYLQNIESDKLYYFLLAESQKNPVVIIKSPADNKAMKNFLGYEWSSAKGNEGIKYIGVNVVDDEDAIVKNKGINQINTPLFNPNDLTDNTKINTIIRNNFMGENAQNPQSDFVSFAKLSDMIDFSRVTFDKAIKTTPEKKIEIFSKYKLVKLAEIVEIVKGITYSKTEQVTEETSNVILTADNITLDGQFVITKKIYLQENKKLDENKKLKKNDIFMCFSSGSKQHVGKLSFIENDELYFAGGFMGILRAKKEKIIVQKYLFEILNTERFRNIMRNQASGANINNLSNSISEIKIPLPPLNIQQKIVTECQKEDEEYNTSRMTMEEYKNKIAEIFENLEITRGGGGINYPIMINLIYLSGKELLRLNWKKMVKYQFIVQMFLSHLVISTKN